MAKYVFLYTGGSRPANEAEGKTMMDAWMAYFQKIGPSIVDGGAPFATPGKRLGSAGETKATGYSVVNADSMDGALALTRDHPHVKFGGGIEVFETMKM